MKNNRLKAEMWDKMQFLFRRYYDRTMHFAQYCDGMIDANAYQKALRIVISQVPVLHSTFHNGIVRPHWEINDSFEEGDFCTVYHLEDDRVDEKAEERLCQTMWWTRKVQLQASIILGKTRSALVITLNHMCCDGGDFKYLIKQIKNQYDLLIAGSDDKVVIKKGSRAYSEVYSTFNEEDKKKAKKLYKNVSNVKDNHMFPLTPSTKEDVIMICRHKLNEETFSKLNKKRKEYGATINDCLLAFYFASLYEIGLYDTKDFVAVPNMIDLRRHIVNDALDTGITNHTGFMISEMNGLGADIYETLKKVQDSLSRSKKDKFIGLYSLPLLNLAYMIFPQCLVETLIDVFYVNPKMGMSNVGILTDEQFGLCGVPVRDMFMTGAVKYKPYMQLALTTYKNEITFSIAIRGNDEDKAIVEKFFAIYDTKVKSFIGE